MESENLSDKLIGIYRCDSGNDSWFAALEPETPIKCVCGKQIVLKGFVVGDPAEWGIHNGMRTSLIRYAQACRAHQQNYFWYDFPDFPLT